MVVHVDEEETHLPIDSEEYQALLVDNLTLYLNEMHLFSPPVHGLNDGVLLTEEITLVSHTLQEVATPEAGVVELLLDAAYADARKPKARRRTTRFISDAVRERR